MFNYLNEKKGQFLPFRVWIHPKWDKLLMDYKMQEQYEKNMEEEKAGLTKNILIKFDVLKEAISFTVLKCDEDNHLIYNDNHHSFHTKVYFRETIERIRFSIKSLSFTFSPDLYVKWGIDGYELGITTPESKENEFYDLIAITEIPYGFFGIGQLLKPEQVKGKLRQYGWVMEEISEERLSGRPLEINHKYFTVYYDQI